ncbi:MAG TPA: outer membrane lipoprotein-sorting protein [Thermoanaerobaculia bacterium]|nr:outer membrane lipoprotein-sorting protein [Thermoanaerobaculia bacterium]
MKRMLVLATMVASLSLSLYADDAAAILRRVDQNRNPLNSFSVDVELTSLSGAKSQTSRFRVLGKDADKSLVEFTAPEGEKGKFLLMLRDGMWIYLPSASRPIRISPLQRLMGQASNGDVARTAFTVDYTPVSVTEEVLDGVPAWVLDLKAKSSGIAYDRVRLWVNRASSEPLRADFYVASGKLIKRALYREYGQMSGRRMLTLVEIDDLIRPGERTLMRYSNLSARDNADKLFTRDSLGKW